MAPSGTGSAATRSPSGAAGADRPVTRRTPRVVAAAKLRRRRDREATGRFLIEGPQALAAAVAAGAAVREVFATAVAASRHVELIEAARRNRVPVSVATEEAVTALSQTVQPQGLVAVGEHLDVPLPAVLAERPRLVAVVAEIRDPGNAGTVLRTADAAGAQAVIFAGDAVDPYNGKCVRASAGSLFQLPVVRASLGDTVTALRAAGLRLLAATGAGETDLDHLLDTGGLAAPTAWLFGSEAHGLPESLLVGADARVRVPIHGRAESLNLGAAAAVCLYASARALRQRESGA